MNEAALKKKAGQAGNADTHPYLRTERLEIRVSPAEKRNIQQNSTAKGFDSVAQFIREQAIQPYKAEHRNARHQSLLACHYQLNRLGNNLNQIARHLNRGSEPDDAILLRVRLIQEHAELLLGEARAANGRER